MSVFFATCVVALIIISSVIILTSVSEPVDAYAKSNITISPEGNNTVVVYENSVIYNGSDPNKAIQQAIYEVSSSNNSGVDGLKEIMINDGYYRFNDPIILPPDTLFNGTGRNSIFDFSKLTDTNTFVLKNNSKLSNIKIIGATTPKLENVGQRIQTSNDTVIENVILTTLGFGIDVQRSENVTINNIVCDFIYGSSDWSACVQVGRGSNNVVLSNFHIANSARGIVVSEGARNIHIHDGLIRSIHNFAGTGNEPFSIDVHNRDSNLRSGDVSFENITLIDSYSPTVKVTNSSLIQDNLPDKIRFLNIKVENPISPWQIGGVDILIKNSSVLGSNYNIINLYSNSKNTTIDGLNVDELHDDKYFISNNPEQSKNISDIKVINSKISVSPDKESSIVSLVGINGFEFNNNTIMNPPDTPFSLSNVTGPNN